MGGNSGTRGSRVARTGILLVVLSLVIVGWMTPAIASAWLSWDGIDPVVALDGDHIALAGGSKDLAVEIEWPSKYTCSIQGPVGVSVSVPAGMDAKVVQESTYASSCESTVSTITSVFERSGGKRNDQIGVSVDVSASKSFPVKVSVFLNGELTQVLRGSSSSVISGWVPTQNK